MTNLERIRSMSAEEMADVLEKNADQMSKICMQTAGSGDCPYLGENDEVPDGACRKCLLKWLNSKAKTNNANPWEKLGIKSPELLAALEAFEEVRKKLRKPFTDKGRALAYRRLTRLSQDEEIQIAIVNQSVERSWQGFFALKTEMVCSDKKSHFMNYNQRRYTPDQPKRMGNNLLEDI